MKAKIFSVFKKLLRNNDTLKLFIWRFRSLFLKLKFINSMPGVYKGKNIQIIGFNKLSILPGCSFGDNLWLNINNGGIGDSIKTVYIGQHSNFGRHNFISVNDGLKIGDYFFSSCYCCIINATHEDDPFDPYISSPVVSIGNGKIVIGANVFMGAHSKIMGSVKIGFGSIIGIGSIVISDVPPLSKVIGAPARVVSRYSINQSRWIRGVDLDDELISEEKYLGLLKEKSTPIPIPYHAASERNGWT